MKKTRSSIDKNCYDIAQQQYDKNRDWLNSNMFDGLYSTDEGRVVLGGAMKKIFQVQVQEKLINNTVQLCLIIVQAKSTYR